MSIISVQARLESIEKEHESDFDGGYAIADALIAFSNQATAEDRDWLKRRFLREVESGDDWGVSLEVLTRAWNRNVSEDLLQLLHNERLLEERRFEVLRSLLRIGEPRVLGDAIKMIDEGLRHDSYEAAAVLAALCHTDADLAIDKYARFLNDKVDNLSSLIVVYVANMVKCDAELLIKVAIKSKALDPLAGEKVANALANEIDRRWYVQEFGKEMVTTIANRLRAL